MDNKTNLKIEFATLRSLTNTKNEEMKFELLAFLNEGHFSSSTTSEIFHRCSSLMRSRGFVPTWRDLATDPGISRPTRRLVKDKRKVKIFRNPEDMRSALTTLESLRKIRGLINLGSNLQSKIEDRVIDVDSAVSDLIQDLSKVTDVAEDSILHHIGEDDNTTQLVKTLLTQGGVPKIPTGLKGFDDLNVGLPHGSLLLLASTTSGGKSTMINQLAENFAMRGAHTTTIPLEMTNEENIQRIVSRVTDADMNSLLDPLERMTEEQRKAAYQRYKKFSKKIAKRGGRITLLEPKFPPTMEKLLNFLKPMDPDVIFIDYVGLLDGMGNSDQWLQLSNALAYAKRWAGLNRKIIVAAAQLSEDGMVRYSRAMKEHSSHLWQWVMTEKSRETGLVKIEQTKCRNGNMAPFILKFEFDKMTVRDVTETEKEEYNSSSKTKTEKNSWADKSSDYDYDYDDQDDRPKKKSKKKSKDKKTNSNLKRKSKKKGRSDDYDDKDFSY